MNANSAGFAMRSKGLDTISENLLIRLYDMPKSFSRLLARPGHNHQCIAVNFFDLLLQQLTILFVHRAHNNLTRLLAVTALPPQKRNAVALRDQYLFDLPGLVGNHNHQPLLPQAAGHAGHRDP